MRSIGADPGVRPGLSAGSDSLKARRGWQIMGQAERKQRRFVTLIFAIVFLLNAAILFLVVPNAERILFRKYSVGFSDEYDLIANNLDTGTGYRIDAHMSETMMREPGYPLFLAGIFAIGGYHIETARLANLVLAFGIALMMMSLARRITHDWAASVLAALLFVLYPGIVMSEARGGVEIIFIFTVMVFMLALYRAVERGNLRGYFLAGLALGVVVQVRSSPLLFPVLLLLYLGIMSKGTAERLKAISNVAVLVAGMAIVMVPWVVRNYRLVHKFVPTASVQGVSLQEGQYCCMHLSLDNDLLTVMNQAGRQRAALARDLGLPFEGTYYYQEFYRPEDELTFSKALSQRAVSVYRSDPPLLLKCVAKNFFNFWFLGKTWQVTWFNMLSQIPLLGLCFGGIYLLWKNGLGRNLGLILLFAIYVLAVHSMIIAHARHSMQIVPFLMIPAGACLAAIGQKWQNRHAAAQSAA